MVSQVDDMTDCGNLFGLMTGQQGVPEITTTAFGHHGLGRAQVGEQFVDVRVTAPGMLAAQLTARI